MFASILPTTKESKLPLVGDDRIKNPDAIITSAFDLPATTQEVYPWFVQLGKKRAGWYFTRRVEPFFIPSARGIRQIEPKWQKLKVGQRIPDYGGKSGYLECFYIEKNKAIGYTSTRGNITMTWVLTFWPAKDGTRVIIRLSAKGFKLKGRGALAVGELFDRMTISWLAAGLKERLAK